MRRLPTTSLGSSRLKAAPTGQGLARIERADI
jgi:hypothetical protein